MINKYYKIILSPLKELSLSQLYEYIQKDGYKISLDCANNIYVQNTRTKNNILVVAHLDRVLNKTPRLFRYESEPEHIYGAYGWDDRAGIIAALELFKNNDIDLLFTTGEESGCVGAKMVPENKINQYKVVFELDRHGSRDFINECSMGVLCNEDFTDDICKIVEENGYNLKPTRGVYTDIGVLRNINRTAQMFYMSCGYYNEHTEDEYLVMEEFISSIKKAQIIINYINTNPDNIKPFVKPVEPEKHTKQYSPKSGFYENEYYYCPKCDEWFLENELIQGTCPYCGGEVEVMEEYIDD